MSPTAAAKPRRKIAILGGGMAALTTAYELTRDPDWKDHLELTVYSLGWRLGGKTATGRGPCERIEEHGIHILQGWYDNTFRLIREVYDERRAAGLDPASPYPTWEQAFARDNATLLTEFLPGKQRWENWPMVFPDNGALPGEGPPLSNWEVVKKLLAMALEILLGSPYQAGEGPLAKWILDFFFPPGARPRAPAETFSRSEAETRPSWWRGVLEKVESQYAHLSTELEVKLLHHARDLISELGAPPGGEGPAPGEVILKLLREFLAWAMARVSHELEDHPRIRRMLMLIELAYVNLKGILEDVYDPKDGKFHFDRIDHLDYRAWIRSHGASELSLRSPVVRFFYTGTFANLNDPGEQGGLLAAGTALEFVLNSAGYKGSFVWKFRAGSGDTMIMPLYEVLRHRGVVFELFREVKQLHASAGGEIEAITMGEQVTLKNGTYEPTYSAGDIRAWPSHPFYDQIDPAEARLLEERGIDLEDPWADWENPRQRRLEKGVDFDTVVLGIPVGSLAACCSEIVSANPRWKRMVEGVATTATLSMQLWLKPGLLELGMNLPDWGMASDDAPNTVVYANPLYSWIDMSLVLPTERWPADNAPRLLVYYTGGLRDAQVIRPYTNHAFPHEQLARVKATSAQWLMDNMGFFWPSGGAPEAPAGLDPRHLVALEGPEATPDQRWASQYFRANVAPWARYTLSKPGTARHRLRPGDSGYANLVLTGDWTDFGINVGYIEGAVISGLEAAKAVRERHALGEGRPPIAKADTAR